MSVTITKFICSALMAVVGLIVVKNISGSKEKLLSIKSIALMICLIIVPAFMYTTEYTYLYTIIIYLITIVTYKYVLDISFSKAVIACGIVFLSLFALDLIASITLAFFLSIDQARNTWYINIITNIIFSITLILIYNRDKIKNKLIVFIEKLSNKRQINLIIFLLLAVIAMSTLLYLLGNNYELNAVFTTNFLIFLIFFLLVIILVGEKNSYVKLSDDYENLFNYVKIFEDWIEDEQLIRHEYKNQLAVLRCLTKEKKVKNKIDEIISDTINIDNHMINQLKNLPSGGLKGLLYYKIAVARNNGINIEVDVSQDASPVLNALGKDELKTISKLIGIYCDNAIEAAKETKKKIVLIEIYEINDVANIVISNTCKENKVLVNRYDKGVSTKGKGRGNGLYFAKKMLTKNTWIEESQEIIDGYYIETLKITKKRKSK